MSFIRTRYCDCFFFFFFSYFPRFSRYSQLTYRTSNNVIWPRHHESNIATASSPLPERRKRATYLTYTYNTERESSEIKDGILFVRIHLERALRWDKETHSEKWIWFSFFSLLSFILLSSSMPRMPTRHSIWISLHCKRSCRVVPGSVFSVAHSRF